MQYLEFKQKLNNFIIFNLSDIRKIEADFDLRRLSEWVDKGYLKAVRRGFYLFSDIEVNERVLYLIANVIYRPSYISLEAVLSLNNLIPESVYGITSVTSLKTNSFRTGFGSFSYKHLKPELMFGYVVREYNNRHYLMAEMEKAVLDYLYLNPHLEIDEDFRGIRFNTREFQDKVDMVKFEKYLGAFYSQALAKRAYSFLSYIKHA